MPRFPLAALAVIAAIGSADAADHYTIDPGHTYPSFEAPHLAGISFWRGKLNQSAGWVVLDRAGKTGSLEITMQTASIDFGHDKMNEHAKGADMFDVAKYPTAVYKASKLVFDGDTLVSVPGELTLHGVTRPVPLKVNSFKCIVHPRLKREVCGADASAEFDRAEFGISYGVPDVIPTGKVRLQIQVEALKDEPTGPQG